MEVRELEERYISFPRWLWRRLKTWYHQNGEGITMSIKMSPLIIIVAGMLGTLPMEDTSHLVFGVDWQVTLVVVGAVTGLIEVAYYALLIIYRWATGLWRDYQEEVWE